MTNYAKLSVWAAVMAMGLTACSEPKEGQQSGQSVTTQNSVVQVGGKDVTKNFAFQDFTGVELASGDDVRVRQGAHFAIRAVGPAAEIEDLVLRIDQGRLIIDRQKGTVATDDVDIEVVMPSLNQLIVTGSGDAKADQIQGAEARLTVTGSGDLDVEGGQVTRATLNLTGSGSLDSEKMRAETLDIRVTGSGEVDAFASGTAAIAINGSGSVKVKGGARCTISRNGSGKAECV